MRVEKVLLEIKELSVIFSRWGQTVKALDKVSLAVPSGQWVMLVGHNGSGKSTLLRAISGGLRSATGIISIEGNSISRLPSSKISEKVFNVHQDPLLGTAPTLTLFENLMVADQQAHNEKTPRKDLIEKYRELLRPLGLSDRMKQLAKYLSGGERQVIALLIARLRPASLMLLDEPLAALDPSKADLCLNLIRSLHEAGRSIIQVTHDPMLAVEGGNRTILLRDGKIVYDKSNKDRKLHEIKELWFSYKGICEKFLAAGTLLSQAEGHE